MQKCKECGASWEVKSILDVCPFCGADFREKATDSIEAALRLILERHGQDVFKSSVLLGFLGDYAPSLTKERKLVKVAVDSGAYRAICTASVAERNHVLNKYVSLLTDSYFIDEMWARNVLMWCVRALDVDSNIEIGAQKEKVDLAPCKDDRSPADAYTIRSDSLTQKNNVVPNLVNGDGTIKKNPSKKYKQGANTPKDNNSNNNGVTSGVKIMPVGDISACGFFQKKKSMVLAKSFFDIREVSKRDCINPIELPNAKFERYYFDLMAKGYIRNVEYYLVTQPDKVLGKEILFVFKNPSGTANPPVFIPEGKLVKQLYDGFKKIFGERFIFEE